MLAAIKLLFLSQLFLRAASSKDAVENESVSLFSFCPNPFNPKSFLYASSCTTTSILSKGNTYHAPLNDVTKTPGYSDAFENFNFSVMDNYSTTLLDFLKQHNNHSFLVYHKGKLVYERYFLEEQDENSLHFQFSATNLC